MDFEYTPKMKKLQAQLQEFMDKHVWPADEDYRRIADDGSYPEKLVDGLKERAKAEGLWNLFLPALKPDEPGTALTNLEYAPLAEIMGKLPWASEVFNCNAPDTGNMEILHLFATPEQRERWLLPLLEGKIRSAVSITEPDQASSDPTNLQTTIERDGDEYVINGRKWFTTGALHPKFAFTLVMGISDSRPDAPRHSRHSFVIVPANIPGFRIVRDVPIMHHHAPEGHCEVEFKDVRVPVSNLLGDEGAGFAVAQARLGPGRIHHCMRTIGQCELALDLMCERALTRRTFGKDLADYSNIRDWIAQSRIGIDQARLLNLYTSWLMDNQGNKAAQVLVSEIKVAAARLQTEVLDRAMQVYGACGITPDTPLSFLWTWGRALRFIDGPDEVHLRGIARNELKQARARLEARGVLPSAAE
ncbi:acyl-CoA dehydrogenase family protein [Paracoccus aerodenitrificans]|uniref:acyl-CoA dehydrogenase family protein n=1 Tax=Paracoccus aerodenitrificans TaxID=3017781 RepID=UPI0022EFDF1C|nr:acyl-CoA dehydrogenase family protein [Paracoccus aerodenitrificans]WBU62750.1 acyl-CoA dehydrogenase family protein [Paracoccus aerodenitrificans]